MVHLLLHRFNLNPELVRAITGPFAEWIESSAPEALTPADIKEAHRILKGLGLDASTDPIKTKTAVRIALMHRICELFVDDWPRGANVPQYFGILIDTHMPVLLQARVMQLHEIYNAGIAPEQVPLKAVCTDMNYPVSTAMAEEMWQIYLSNLPAKPGSSASRTKKSGDAAGSRRKRGRATSRKRKRSGSGVVLVDSTATDPDRPFSVAQDPRVFVKIATKGMPRSASVRSIRSLLSKVLLGKPRENQATLHMIRLYLLGAYRHCRRIAPPRLRINIYRESVESSEWMYSKLRPLTSKSLYAVVAEYAIGMATTVPALFYLLERDPDWTDYYSQAIDVCDTYLRPNLYNKTSLLPPKIEVGFYKPLRSSDVFWALVKALNVKDRVPRRIVDSARLVTGNMSQMYKTFRMQQGVPRIFAKALRDVKMDEADIEVIENGFDGLTPQTIQSRFTTMIKELSSGANSVLYLYVHMLLHQSKFAIIPNRLIRDEVVPTDRIPAVLVCMQCCTIRSQAEGVTSAKSKDGTHIDTLNFEITCSSCGFPGVKRVDLRHNRVVGLSINDMTKPQLFTMCRQCHCTTVYKNVIGCNELCTQCYDNACSRLVPRRCICGTVFTNRNVVKCAFVAKDDDGKYAVWSLCDDHIKVADYAVGPDHPIQFYRNLIASL